MSIKISDDCMCLEIDGIVIASEGTSRWLVGSQPLAPILRP